MGIMNAKYNLFEGKLYEFDGLPTTWFILVWSFRSSTVSA